MITPLYCCDCKMEECCEKTKEVCKYPEGRIHGVEAERPSKDRQIHLLTRQLQIAREGLAGIRDHEHCKEGGCYQDKNPVQYFIGRRETANGHRCCANIATETLNKMEEVK